MLNPIIVQACILGTIGVVSLWYLIYDIWTTLKKWKEEGMFDD